MQPRLRSILTIASGVLALSGSAAFAQAPWPGDAGVEIGQIGTPGYLPAGYEPSGAAWHRGLQRLVIVGDDGDVSCMNRDGGGMITWTPGGDLEAVAIADHDSSLVYLGREHPDAVIEFDLATGLPTGELWDLQPWMTGPNNAGLEALTVANGLFYAGLQDDGNVFVFDLQPAGVVSHLGTMPPHAGRDDVSGLHYDDQTEVLYTIHDTANVIVERTLAGSFLVEYTLAGNAQEGIALVPCCSLGVASVFVAQDDGELWRYEDYPTSCTAGPFESYCTAGTSASGCQALLVATGTPSATAASGFALDASGVEGSKDALLFFGKNGRHANPWGSGSSFQCVVPPVKRAGLLIGIGTVGQCDGSFSQDLNARWTAKPAQNPGAGAVVQAQLWYRDPFSTSNQTTSLSDAIEFCVGP